MPTRRVSLTLTITLTITLTLTLTLLGRPLGANSQSPPSDKPKSPDAMNPGDKSNKSTSPPSDNSKSPEVIGRESDATSRNQSINQSPRIGPSNHAQEAEMFGRDRSNSG